MPKPPPMPPVPQPSVAASSASGASRVLTASVPASAAAAVWLAVVLLAAPAPVKAARDEVTAVQELLARGQPQAALERLLARQGSLVLMPGAPSEDAELRFLHGVALMDLQRHAEALAWFERMAQDHPELPDPHNNIALLHVRAGRLEPARQALEAALRNDPSFRTARANLGLVHLMLALQAFEHVAASGPADWQLTRRLEGTRALLAAATRP